MRASDVYVVYVNEHDRDFVASEASEETWISWMLDIAELVTAEGAHEEFVPVSSALTKTIEALSESPYQSMWSFGAWWRVHVEFFF